jgi:hypothetical protein
VYGSSIVDDGWRTMHAPSVENFLVAVFFHTEGLFSGFQNGLTWSRLVLFGFHDGISYKQSSKCEVSLPF